MKLFTAELRLTNICPCKLSEGQTQRKMRMQSGGLRGISHDPTQLKQRRVRATAGSNSRRKVSYESGRSEALVEAWGGRGCIRFTNKNSINHDPRGGPPHHPLSSWERTSPRFAPTSFFI